MLNLSKKAIANILLFFLIFSPFYSHSKKICQNNFSHQLNYAYPSSLLVEDWLILEPLFFPADHLDKIKIDYLFKTKETLSSEEAFKKRGFKFRKKPSVDRPLSASHAYCKNYLFNVFLNSHLPKNELLHFLNSLRASQAIETVIQKYSFQWIAIPKTWLYPLPYSSENLNNYLSSNFVLISEKILPNKQCNQKQAFKKFIHKEMLCELFQLLQEIHLPGCLNFKNVIFSEEGKMILVNLESYNQFIPIHYEKLTPYLTPEMQTYWQNLFQTAKKK